MTHARSPQRQSGNAGRAGSTREDVRVDAVGDVGVGVPGISRSRYGPAVPASAPAGADWAGDAELAPGRSIFFLCGHPRSGTHWVGNILNLHPRIVVEGEYHLERVVQAVDRLVEVSWHAAHRQPMRGAIKDATRDLVRRTISASVALKPGATWLGDRSPRPMRALLRGAPHVLILRDPRDLLVSWTFKELADAGFQFRQAPFRGVMDPLREALLGDPSHFARHPERLLQHEAWVRHIAGLSAEHTRATLAGLGDADRDGTPVHVVRYEMLHADTEGQRRLLYEFLGLDPAEARPLSIEDKTLPGLPKEAPRGLYRKGAVGDWEKYFTPTVRRWFAEAAGDMLRRLGYEADDAWVERSSVVQVSEIRRDAVAPKAINVNDAGPRDGRGEAQVSISTSHGPGHTTGARVQGVSQ